MSFSFGTPSSAPVTGLTGGFNFGANKTPAFGLTATSQPSTGGLFGNTPTTSFGGTPTFGATSTPAFGATSTPAFGATSTPAFGATTAPAFGATATPAFGATAAPAFGSTATPAFGATAAPAFGSTAAPAFGSTATPSFGAGATSTPSFGGTPAPAFGSTAAPAFGVNTSGFGSGGLSFGAGNTATTSAGLTLGNATTANTGLGGLGGFSFNTSQPTTSGGFGLLGASTTTTSSLFGPKLGGTSVAGVQSSVTATPSLGLGGVVPIVSGTGSTDSKDQQPKQTKLPNEISTPVEAFKEFVKKQKAMSSDLMRASVKPLHQVALTAEEQQRGVRALGAQLARAKAASRRARCAAAAALAAADRAARAGSEFESSGPPAYIKELLSELEQQLIAFRRQMDTADKQMQATPRLLSEQELTMGIRRMHESFVALAARLQAVHSQVQLQKEQYLNLRKQILKDSTDVFDASAETSGLDQILRDADGGKKKTKLLDYSDLSQGSAVLSDPLAALGSLQHLAGPSPFTYLGNTMSPYTAPEKASNWTPQQIQPTFGTSLNTSGGNVSAFQLQKPPKRGKQ